jgi:PKD repeat protein
MYKAVFNEDITNIGYVTNYANVTVLNVHGTIGRSNVRTYLWLGDASIEPWTLQPMNLTVTHDEQIFLGTSEFTANVLGTEGPVENAMVCVSNEDGSVYAVAYTDAAGQAIITFDEPVQTPGDAKVTVTRHNYLPYQGTVPVIPQEGPYVVKDSYEINDIAGGNGNGMMDYAESILLTLSVKNVGIMTAENVVVTLSTEDEYITITDGEENYGDVEPNEIVSVTDGFAFDVAENLPDGHAVLFEVAASDGTDTWTSNIIITGHAPVLELGEFIISDPTGNNNGKIDPGETVQISVYVNNTGSADAFAVFGELVSNDMYLQVNTADPQEYGDIAAEGTSMASFEVYADEDTPAGHVVELEFDITADYNITGNGMFNVVVGQIPVVIIDFDPNYSSGPVMQGAIEDLGVAVEYKTTMPADLNLYSSAFVCLGIYSGNHTLSAAEGLALAGLLDAGGALYMEGGDTWYYDASTAVHTYFNINATSDGSDDLGTIEGQAGTITEGLSYNYSGENNWIDHIEPIGDAEQIFMNTSPSYGCGVSYDEGSYMTIGASFEFGGLDDSDATKTELMESYLQFFGILQSGVAANFVADATDICEGDEVQFTDYSTGGVTEWAWEFEGGTPAASTEQNPVVTYSETGEFDVTLTVTGPEGSNTMTKNDYINAMTEPEIPENLTGEEQVCQGNTDIYSVDEVLYALSYVWVLDPPEAGTLVENGNECTITWSDQVEGIAMLKVCGVNDCGEGPWSEEFEVLVQNCTGIESNTDKSVLSIYPNPNTGNFTLELNANDQFNLRVINAIGEVVYKLDRLDVNGFYVKVIELNDLAEGVYYLRLEGNTMIKTEKIVISR